jgi:uncharacterized protein YggE
MFQARLAVAVALIVATASFSPLYGQTLGSHPAGMNDSMSNWWGTPPDPGAIPPLAPLDRRVATEYISIDGRADVRLKPTSIRLVLAVIVDGENGQQCQRASDATIARLREAWAKIGIGPERVAEDFVSAVNRYQWKRNDNNNWSIEAEKKIGIHLQTNVHLAARGEDEARKAIARAMEQNVTDIVSCDYWTKDLDEAKVKARKEALAAARGKAESLLGTLFGEQPPVVNVQEQTTVKYPESLYHSISSDRDKWLGMGGFMFGNQAEAANRQYTYYRLPNNDADISPRELSLTPEITVVSTVRLYYKSPSADGEKKAKPAKKGS